MPDEQARLLAMWEGTTPQGREIFRKPWVQTSNLSQHNKDTRQLISHLEMLLSKFPELRTEFLLIFCGLFGQQHPPVDMTLRDLATLMVLRIRLEQARESLNTASNQSDV